MLKVYYFSGIDKERTLPLSWVDPFPLNIKNSENVLKLS